MADDIRAALRELVEIEAIKQLKAKYFLLTDSKMWDEWRELFTDDAQLGGTALAGGLDTSSIDAFVATARTTHTGATAHHGHMPLIELRDDSSARGLWALGAIYTDDGHDRRMFYEEEYRKEEGRWKISSMMIWLMPAFAPEADRESCAEQFRGLACRWAEQAPGGIV